jgi:hypothetical protein
MPAEDAMTLRMPRDLSEGKLLLSRASGSSPNDLAELPGLSERRLNEIVRVAIDTSSTGEEFLFKAVREIGSLGAFAFVQEADEARRQLEAERRLREGAPSPTITEATPVANQTDDIAALGREVSGLGAKVNILMGIAGGSALLNIGGAIALWQAMGGVETRLTRELGQVETRITQQIADVRSEVGEIRGWLSAQQGQADQPPPR